MLAALAKSDRPLTTIEVAGITRIERSIVLTLLTKLMRQGQVQRSKSGGRKSAPGQKSRRWRLNPARAVDLVPDLSDDGPSPTDQIPPQGPLQTAPDAAPQSIAGSCSARLQAFGSVLE